MALSCVRTHNRAGVTAILKPRSHRARQRASMRVDASNQTNVTDRSTHTDRVDARQLICIHQMSEVSLSYT